MVAVPQCNANGASKNFNCEKASDEEPEGRCLERQWYDLLEGTVDVHVLDPACSAASTNLAKAKQVYSNSWYGGVSQGGVAGGAYDGRKPQDAVDGFDVWQNPNIGWMDGCNGQGVKVCEEANARNPRNCNAQWTASGTTRLWQECTLSRK
eukprot:TRINITY_DN24343_c0_g1_i1.p2 TRINITY_DN24343_c0_g1~~TRINITY_DN24343_c0_g1_i1.p2  ORF type:complete len:151 (+),score=27.36 TRINITY_DN24343_c0_g1_i1:79-531(+)